MRVMVAGIRKAREIAAQPAMAEWTGRELSPGIEAQSDEELQDYIRKTHNTVYHPVGTVRMGPVDDDMSPPLDPSCGSRASPGCAWPMPPSCRNTSP